MALPFEPFGPLLDQTLLVDGMPGATGAVRLSVWDAQAQAYAAAVWPLGRSNGCWELEVATNPPALKAGLGFWIENDSGEPCGVYVAGRIFTGETTAIEFPPGVSQFGSPFASVLPAGLLHGVEVFQWTGAASERLLWTEEGDPPHWRWEQGDDAFIELGRGYMAIVPPFSPRIAWPETRPYGAGFDDAVLPRIRGVSLSPAERRIVLSVDCDGAAGGRIEIFAQDLGAQSCLDLENGWRPAAELSVTGGQLRVVWMDPQPPDYGRSYLVRRQATTTAPVELPEVRTALDATVAIPSASLSVDNSAGNSAANAGATQDGATTGGDGQGGAPLRGSVSFPRLGKIGSVIYVSQNQGDDRLTGAALMRNAAGDGPKKRFAVDSMRFGPTARWLWLRGNTRKTSTLRVGR